MLGAETPVLMVGKDGTLLNHKTKVDVVVPAASVAMVMA